MTEPQAGGASATHVGVVVVTYNSASVVEGLLDSLPAGLGDLPGSVVVVDNGSTDGTVELARRQGCQVVAQGNLGYSAGINRGARELTHASELMILNPDTRVEPGSIAALVSASARHPDVGIVVPRVEGGNGDYFSLRREPTLLRSLGLSRLGSPSLSERLDRPSDYATARVVDWATGAAMLVTRRCYDTVGAWDESYFLYSEETDFCRAARDRGFLTLFEPSAVVHHSEGGSGRSPQTHAMQALNRVRYYRRRHAALPSSAYLALTAAQESLWALRGHEGAPEAVRELLRKDLRPDALGLPDRLIPR